MPICSHCNKEIKTTDRWHIRMCAKRPSNEQLIAMRQKERLSILTIARRYDVSHRAARNWLIDARVFTGNERRFNNSSLQVLAGTAICKIPTRGCRKCKVRELCCATVAQAQWALCEQMDEQQVIRRRGDGIDLHQVAVEVRERIELL